jgi:hypothetical protein
MMVNNHIIIFEDARNVLPHLHSAFVFFATSSSSFPRLESRVRVEHVHHRHKP